MLSTDSSFPVVDFRELASAQVGDPELDKLHVLIPLFVLSKFLWLSQEECPSPATHPQAACDTSTGNLRPYVPQSYRRHVFNILHSMSHPGIRNKQRLVTCHFVWPSINADARRWARSCVFIVSVRRFTNTPPHPLLCLLLLMQDLIMCILISLDPYRHPMVLLTCVA